MDRLWTPWRNEYVSRAGSEKRKGIPAELAAWPVELDRQCVFCNLIGSVEYAIEKGMEPAEATRAAGIVHRGHTCFVCLNAFPYGTGHLLVVPYEHADSLVKVDEAAALSLMRLARVCEEVLREVYRPNGLNLGINLGESAGAGVAEHLHLHILPRWSGDTNFMTVVGETRVLPEALGTTWAKLAPAFVGRATLTAKKPSL